METQVVIFRMCYNPYTKVWEPSAFFPYSYCGVGNIVCYAHNEGHGTAALSYYQHSTKKAEPEQYAELLKELKQIYEEGDEPVRLVIQKRINWDKIRECWMGEPKCKNCDYFLEVTDNKGTESIYCCLNEKYPYANPADIAGDHITDKTICYVERGASECQ